MCEDAKRKELLEVFDKSYEDVRAVIENGDLIPEYFTTNGSLYGVTIILRDLQFPSEGMASDDELRHMVI